MTQAAVAAADPKAHLRGLDGIRGFAVLLVVLYHAGYLTAGWGPRLLPGGFVGVDLFFVLSGFLITRILVRELDQSDGISLGRFGLRRVRRLMPALVVFVVAVLTFLWATDVLVDTHATLTSAAGTLLYVSNYQQARGWTYPIELSHTWSLAIEAQFYLFWPFVLLAFHRLRLPRTAQLVTVLLAIVAVSLHRAAMWTDQAHYLPLYLRTDTRIDVILAGCALGLVASWGWLTPSLASRLRGPAMLGLMAIAAVSLLSETGDVHLYRHFGLLVVTIAATAVVASTVVDPQWAVTRTWSLRPLTWLGDRSYSLYLWHVPVFLTVARHLGDQPVLLRLGTGLSVALLLTEASYRLVEQRFRRPGYQPSRPTWLDRLITWCASGPRRTTVIAALVGAVPMLVAVIALSRFTWHPVGDLAQAMLRQYSFWSDPPLVGPAGRIGPFGGQGNHPGPLMFWITWPAWKILGSSSWAYQASVALITLLAYCATVMVVHRRGGWPVALVIATVGAVLMRSFGPVALTQPWNPYLPLIPFLLFVVLCWLALCGHVRLLPGAVAAGSFCVQCHVGYAPAAVAGLAISIGGLFLLRIGDGWESRRRGALPPSHDAKHRATPDEMLVEVTPRVGYKRLFVWSGVSALVGVILWIPPILDQLNHRPGNMRILLDTYRTQTGHVIGLRSGAHIVLTQLNPFGNWLLGTRHILATPVPGALLLLAWCLGVGVAWRARHQVLLRLDAVLAAMLACALFWSVRLDSVRYLYLVEWFWVITALMVVTVGWCAAIVLRSRRPTWPALRTVSSSMVSLLLVSTAVFTWTAVGVTPPDMSYSRTIAALAPSTVEALDPTQRYLVRWTDPIALGGPGFGMLLELERQGLDVGAPKYYSAAVEPHRVRAESDADSVITVVSGDDNIALARRIPGAREVAATDHRSPAERARYQSLQDRAREELVAQGLPEVANQISGTIWAGLIDPRVNQQTFETLSEMLSIGVGTAVFVSTQPLPGL